MKKIFLIMIALTISLLSEVTQRIPYLNVSGSYSTFIKVFNNSSCTIKVNATVYGDNGATNANTSLIEYASSIETKKTILLWASDLKTKASAQGVSLPNSFGSKLSMSCIDASTLKSEDVVTVIVQKSPEGQRVIPVSEPSSVDSGAKIIPYVSQSANYITFIKVMNSSNTDINVVLKAYPDATGTEYTMNQSFPANRVTLLWANTLATTMSISENAFALEVSATSGLSNLDVVAIQKTTNGPRIIEVSTSGVN